MDETLRRPQKILLRHLLELPSKRPMSAMGKRVHRASPASPDSVISSGKGDNSSVENHRTHRLQRIKSTATEHGRDRDKSSAFLGSMHRSIEGFGSGTRSGKDV
jgi:hypothetical protein